MDPFITRGCPGLGCSRSAWVESRFLLFCRPRVSAVLGGPGCPRVAPCGSHVAPADAYVADLRLSLTPLTRSRAIDGGLPAKPPRERRELAYVTSNCGRIAEPSLKEGYMHCCMASSGRRFVIAAGLAMLVGGLLGERGPSAQATPQRAGAEAGLTANSQTFVDPTGDNLGGSPDITTVRASNDDAGNLELQLVIPNRTDLTDPDFIGVYVDTDRSVSTGCNLGGGFGADWALAALGRTAPAPDRLFVAPHRPRLSTRTTGHDPSGLVRRSFRQHHFDPHSASPQGRHRRPSRGSASRCSRLPIRSVPRHPTRPATSRPGSTRFACPAQYRLAIGLPHV